MSTSEAAARLAAATLEIFGVAWCELIEADGGVIGRAGVPPRRRAEADEVAASAVAKAMLGLAADQRRMEVGTPPGAEWTDGDQAGLEAMALLAGSVLSGVDVIGRAVSRADRLDRLNRMQREFLRSVSHNLRAPLATIELVASDLVEMDADPFVRTRAQAIRVEARRLARLVDQVLTLSRMEAGTLSLDGEPVALAPLVRRIAAELGIGDRVEVVDMAPGIVAFTDPGATEQIAWILLDNAARYAAEGPILAEISAAGAASAQEIVLAIEDQGPGVVPAERRRIFRRFVRGTSLGDGAGLGLSVARGLARSLGGDVTYRPGAVGARFEVRMPADGGFVELDEPGAAGGAIGSTRA